MIIEYLERYKLRKFILKEFYPLINIIGFYIWDNLHWKKLWERKEIERQGALQNCERELHIIYIYTHINVSL